MKSTGICLTLLAAAIIALNVYSSTENHKRINDDFWGTLFSGGDNLIFGGQVYTFTPPFTNFEIVVMVIGLVGIILWSHGSKKNS